MNRPGLNLVPDAAATVGLTGIVFSSLGIDSDLIAPDAVGMGGIGSGLTSFAN